MVSLIVVFVCYCLLPFADVSLLFVGCCVFGLLLAVLSFVCCLNVLLWLCGGLVVAVLSLLNVVVVCC